MKKSLNLISLLLLMAITTGFWQSCSKSSSSSSSSSSSAVALAIQTGAQSMAPGVSIPFTAVLIDKSGNTSTPSSVTWSITGDGGASLGTFSGSTFTSTGIGTGVITATTTVNGSTLTAKLPIAVYSPTIFSVVPSAVIWTTGAGTIPLTPVYIGTGTPSYTYSSSDATVASVDATGNISFLKAGQCVITVSGTVGGTTANVSVPVLVTGMPTGSLPVMRVAVTPNSYQMFRNDNYTLTAKAYDMSGNVVTGSTITWASQSPAVATVDQTGKVTALSLGRAVITATASGITGQAEIDVLPDTAIILSPIWATIAPGATATFTANAYTVTHTTPHTLTPISLSPITFSIPSFGIPMLDSMFGIATVDASSGVVTMKSSATFGMSSIVMATTTSPTVEPGVAMITVGSSCGCGTTDAGVVNITGVPTSTVNLSVSGMSGATTYQITANAVNSTGGNVSGATIHYCSSSLTACSIDATGLITATAPGTSTITFCDGSIVKTFTLNVSL